MNHNLKWSTLIIETSRFLKSFPIARLTIHYSPAKYDRAVVDIEFELGLCWIVPNTNRSCRKVWVKAVGHAVRFPSLFGLRVQAS
jgi:hypothetical protein